MLKSDLVEQLTVALSGRPSLAGGQVSKANAQLILETVLGEIANGVKKHGLVQIAGFGTFKKKERPARMGPKPGTGEKIQYPASTTMSFKPGKELKEKIS